MAEFKKDGNDYIIRYHSKKELKTAVNGFIDEDIDFDLFVNEKSYSIWLTEKEWNKIENSIVVWLRQQFKPFFDAIYQASELYCKMKE
jgi:hypothetical protein